MGEKFLFEAIPENDFRLVKNLLFFEGANVFELSDQKKYLLFVAAKLKR